jgi:hypothetical protein
MYKKMKKSLMKNIIFSISIINLIFNSFAVFAQSIENHCYVTLYLKTDDEKIERAKFYQSAREKLKVEFTLLIFKDNGSSFGKKYYAVYNKEKDAWSIKLPYGMYRFRTEHVGFDDYRKTVVCEQPTLIIEENLKIENLAYTYEDGKKYNYIKGGIEFSETVIVHFKGGTPDENKAFLETFQHEKIQKLRYINAFFLTLNLSNQEPLPEILIRETYGDAPLGEGYYFGDAITGTIEKLMENPNVSYANPTFIFPKKDIQVLSTKDFATIPGLTNTLKNRKPDEPMRLNPDEFEKSDALQQKLLKELEEK